MKSTRVYANSSGDQDAITGPPASENRAESPGPARALAAFAKLLDPDRCRHWLLSEIHPRGAVCPGCRRQVGDAGRLQRFWSGRRVRCRHCGKFFSAATGTFLAGNQMGWAGTVFLLGMLETGLSVRRIGELAGCSPETVRIWRNKIAAMEKLKGAI